MLRIDDPPLAAFVRSEVWLFRPLSGTRRGASTVALGLPLPERRPDHALKRLSSDENDVEALSVTRDRSQAANLGG